MNKNELLKMLISLEREVAKDGIDLEYEVTESNRDMYVDVRLKERDYSKSMFYISYSKIEQDIRQSVEEFKRYVERQDLERGINSLLDLSDNKFETLKNIVSKCSNQYSVCIRYDLLGLLELQKVNAKSIMCVDSVNNKIRLDLPTFRRLYVKGDTIKLYEKYE